MLDQLRKHASNWVIKASLALIIGTFTLFFGYQRFAGKDLERQNYAAIIGNEAVPLRKFELAYESTSKKMRDDFKEKVPENFDETLRSMIVGQLVQEEVATAFARSLKLRVSPQRISTQILHHPALAREGHFDYDYYQRVFRPSYEQRTGEDFESSLEKQILRDDLDLIARDCFEPWQKSLPGSQGTEELLATWLRHFQQGVKTEILVR